MLRWLLPIVTVLVMLGTSVAAFACAGPTGDPSCCCPVKAKCKCHDHDGKRTPTSTPTLERCGGSTTLAAPVTPAALAPVTFHLEARRPVTMVASLPPLLARSAAIPAPETPPF